LNDEMIYRLARRAGLLVDWTDAAEQPQRVSVDALRRILAALGYACDTRKSAEDSLATLATIAASPRPGLITCDIDTPITLPNVEGKHGRLVYEDGTQQDIRLQRNQSNQAILAPIPRPGYHILDLDDRAITLAVAPRRCFTLADATQDEKLWGLAVQLYGLRRGGDYGIGDTSALSRLARAAAANGADVIAISPTHALFTARPDIFSPYAPSNRLLLNPLLADPGSSFERQDIEAAAQTVPTDALWSERLIDWPRAAKGKMALFRALFDLFSSRLSNVDDELVRHFASFRKAGGALLEGHARFEAIHAKIVAHDPLDADWRRWPAEFSAPNEKAVSDYAAAHARDVTFHVFLQWLADRAFGAAQRAARHAGMRLGLVADLAVGMEPGGSHTWAYRQDVLSGLTIGAPPDLFNAQGQNWGLTTFSPSGLVAHNFKPFIDTLRAAMRYAGGIRIDHILGLNRLWVVPDGANASEGAYLSYPFHDLLRLVRLESMRHRAVVIGEDLGTVPPGLRSLLSESGIAGLDVLWFSRDENGFADPSQWRRDAVAMTTTHDLPTVAGWWRGADISFRAEHGLVSNEGGEETVRAADRHDLWRAFTEAKVATTPPPPPEETSAVIDEAITFVSSSGAPLVLLPLEDLLGLEEQPNIPGTIDTHSNWCRRYPIPVAETFDAPDVAARIKVLNKRRRA
jgi:4-alpha-glucanotransferase